MSANDIRDLENLNPLSDADGGNAYLVNGNMIPITAAKKGGNATPTPSSDRKSKEETK